MQTVEMQLLQLFFVCLAVEVSLCAVAINKWQTNDESPQVDISNHEDSIINDSEPTKPTGVETSQPTVADTPKPSLQTNAGDCLCVPYYQCRSNKTIINDGAGLIQIKKRSVGCEHDLEVCCYHVIKITDETTASSLQSNQTEGSKQIINVSELTKPTGVETSQPSSQTSAGDCTCVYYYQCNDTAISEVDADYTRIEMKERCEHHLDVCCFDVIKSPDEATTPSNLQTNQTEQSKLIVNVSEPTKPTGIDTSQPTAVNPSQPTVSDTPQTSPQINASVGGCICVPFYQCDRSRTIIEDGAGLIDIRPSRTFNENKTETIERIFNEKCASFYDVCCYKATNSTDEPTTPNKLQTNHRRLTHKTSKCGQRNFNDDGFQIIGAQGNEANFGEFPWMVAVLQEVHNPKEMLILYECGGSLIHPQVVLTAAHCVTGIDQIRLKVRAGEWDTQTVKEIYPHQDRKVKEVIIHENYYAETLLNDIALLIMETPFEITEHVDLICLPDEGEVMDGRECTASGWGKDVFGKQGKYQVIMKKVELPIVSKPQCTVELRKTRLGQHFKLHESFICAGGEPGKDTCTGDGGSPLVCPSQNNSKVYRQAGIVSWGIGCGEAIPGVYVNVPLFTGWITSKLISYNIDKR